MTDIGGIDHLFSFLTPSQQKEAVFVYCELYKPVYWSKKDTRLTQDQIVVNNAVFKKYCL